VLARLRLCSRRNMDSPGTLMLLMDITPDMESAAMIAALILDLMVLLLFKCGSVLVVNGDD
jgi:hypothetical protein